MFLTKNHLATCTTLGKPNHGTVSFNKGKVANAYPIDTEATYTCYGGYRRTSGSHKRKCKAGNVWDGNVAVCQPSNNIFKFFSSYNVKQLFFL